LGARVFWRSRPGGRRSVRDVWSTKPCSIVERRHNNAYVVECVSSSRGSVHGAEVLDARRLVRDVGHGSEPVCQGNRETDSETQTAWIGMEEAADRPEHPVENGSVDHVDTGESPGVIDEEHPVR
jgi:hypothetical protein